MRDSFSVVLHQASVAENIGAVARVMGNTGFSRLVLSDPRVADLSPAYKTAVSADGILDNALSFPDLPQALSGAGAEFVVASSARDRSDRRNLSLARALGPILENAAIRPVALVFGPERTGLTNEDLDRCHLLLTIPTAGSVTSYNLSHAVLLVLFSLADSLGSAGETGEDPSGGERLPAPERIPYRERTATDRLASREELEGMYAHLEQMLLAAGFLWAENPDHMMRLLRELFNRAAPRKREVQVLRGVCRTLLYRLRGRE